MKRTALVIVVLALGLAALLIWLNPVDGADSSGPDAAPTDASDPVSELAGSSAGAESGKARDRRAAAPDATGEKAESGTRVYGRVVLGEGGAPAAGARVHLGDAQTHTGEDGGFAFVAVEPGGYRLYAEKEGLISFSRLWNLKPVKVEEADRMVGPLKLTLTPAARLRVVVLSASDDRAIAGARVEPDRAPKLAAETDEDGEAILQLTPELWEIVVKAEGREADAVNIKLSEERETRTVVRLKPGGYVAGRVVDEAGAPLPEVGVSAYQGRAMARLSARTDQAGRFRLDSLSLARELTLSFIKRGYPVQRTLVHLTARDPGATVDMTLVSLEKAREDVLRVKGYVRDELEEPIEGARLSLGRWSMSAIAIADGEGRFELPIQRERFIGLGFLAEASGYAPKFVQLAGETGRDPIIVTLEPGHWLAGRVIDEWGQPVPGAFVSAAAKIGRYRLFGGEPAAVTDEDGRFHIDSLPAQVSLDFFAPGFSIVSRDDLAVDQDGAEITLPGSGVLFGTVVDRQSGRAVTSFNIALKMPSSRVPGASRWHGPGLPSSMEEKGADFQSPRGEFRIESLNAGRVCNLVVRAEGYAEIAVENTVIGSEKEAAPLTIELEPDGLRLAGEVRDREGRAMAGARLCLLISMKRERPIRIERFLLDGPDYGGVLMAKRFAETDRLGRFAFEDVPAGRPLDLLIDARGAAKKMARALERRNPGELAALVIEVDPAAQVYGKVDLNAFPDAASVSLTSANFDYEDRAALQRDGENAAFVFDDLPAGAYTLTLASRDWDAPRQGLGSKSTPNLAPGDAVEVHFGEALHRLAGQVFVNEKPMTPATVFLVKGAKSYRSGWFDAEVDGEGRFVFERVEAGVYDVVAVAGLVESRLAYQIVANHPNRETITLDRDMDRVFHFRRIGALRGRLAPPPEERARVNLLAIAGRGGGMAEVSADGGFVISKAAPGEYALYLYVGGSSRIIVSSIVMPASGEDLDLGVIDLEPDKGYGALRVEIADGVVGQRPWAGVIGPDGELIASKTMIGGDAAEFDNLEPGAVDCYVNVAGYRCRPASARVEIVADQTATARFQLEPIAELYLSVKTQDAALANVRMVRAGNGAAVQFSFLDAAQWPRWRLNDEGIGRGFFSDRFGGIRGVAAGDWSIVAESADGRQWRKTVALARGHRTLVDVFFE